MQNLRGSVDRFEVRPGYAWSGEGVQDKQRAEYSGNATKFAFNTNVWVSYRLKIEPFDSEAILALAGFPFLIPAQFLPASDVVDAPSSPVCALELTANGLSLVTRSTPDNPNTTNPPKTVLDLRTDFQYGEWVGIFLRVKFNYIGAAELQFQAQDPLKRFP